MLITAGACRRSLRLPFRQLRSRNHSYVRERPELHSEPKGAGSFVPSSETSAAYSLFIRFGCFPLPAISLDQPLHLWIEFHAESVCQAIHKIKGARDQHDIDYLVVRETALPGASRSSRLVAEGSRVSFSAKSIISLSMLFGFGSGVYRNWRDGTCDGPLVKRFIAASTPAAVIAGWCASLINDNC